MLRSGIILLVLSMTFAGHVYTPPPASENENSEPDIRLYYLHNTPFFTEGDSMAPMGVAVPRLIDMLKKTGLTWSFHYVSWPRALRAIESQENALIFPITKAEGRYPDVKFLMPLYYSQARMLGKASAPFDALSPQDIQSGNYKAICFVDTVDCDILTKLGFSGSNLLKMGGSVPNQSQNLTLLSRADVFIGDKMLAGPTPLGPNILPNSFKVIKGYQSTTIDYLGAGPTLRSDLEKKLRAAIAKMPDLTLDTDRNDAK